MSSPRAGRWRDRRAASTSRRRTFYPNVNLLASVSQMCRGRARCSLFLSGTGTGWSAGPAMSLPIFEGGRLRSRTRRGVRAVRPGGRALQRHAGRRAEGNRRPGRADALARFATDASAARSLRRSKNYQLARRRLQARPDRLPQRAHRADAVAARSRTARRASGGAARGYASLQAALGGGSTTRRTAREDGTLRRRRSISGRCAHCAASARK